MATRYVDGFTRKEFVEKFYPIIERSVRGTGLLPGTALATAIVESSGKVDGKWLVGGSKLSRKANNYHGIKCHGWPGRKYEIETREEKPNGESYKVVACFRHYPSVEASIRDWVKFLQENPRYKKVFKQTTVYDQAVALKAAGYATGNNYARVLYDTYLSQKPLIIALNKKKSID